MLTTRCPHCHTAFRIRPEQLSVRGGRVRCGHCQQAFSALAQLEELDDEERPLAPPAPQRPLGGAAPQTMVPSAVSAPRPVPAKPAAQPASPPNVGQGIVGIPQASLQPAPQEIRPAVRASVAPPVSTADLVNMPIPLSAAEPGQRADPHLPWASFALDTSSAEEGGPREPRSVVTGNLLPDGQAEHPAPDFILEGDAPVFRAETTPVKPAAVGPAVAEDEEQVSGDDFSMNILLAEEDFPSRDNPADLKSGAPNPTQDATGVSERFDPAHALGVPAADFAREQIFDQTVMLEEPIDLASIPVFDNGPDSLFDERERQRRLQTHGVEDRRAPRSQASAWRWGLGLVAMLVLAAIQLVFVFRTELARSLPALRPRLEVACAQLGCRVPYPQDAEQISLEGHSFNPEAGSDSRFRLVVTLLNKAPYQQAWPHLELTVTDRFDIAVARRVFSPAEWLPAQNRSQAAFAGHSEITANLPVSISGLPAAGYRLYVFYP